MNVVDSSGWLAYFADEPTADFFASAIEDTSQLIVPSISIYEVFKRILQQRSEKEALQAVVIMMQGKVVDLNVEIALESAKISSKLKLPMADSMILATAQIYNAILWTQDIDLKGIEGVQYIQKES
ncbi:MAG: type II toxin-antitoxin system VapC family toxin [Microcystaceae cyanobacterium]